jgi:hemoglobin
MTIRLMISALLLTCVALAGAATSPLAAAPRASGAVVAAEASTSDALYRELGERDGLARMMVDLVAMARADARIGHFFKDTDSTELAKQLTDQLCQVAGGPCAYKGGKMRKVHADMGVRKGDFNTLVELLQRTMDAHGVPFGAQNRLLARLAPMHRDIIEPQGPPPVDDAH